MNPLFRAHIAVCEFSGLDDKNKIIKTLGNVHGAMQRPSILSSAASVTPTVKRATGEHQPQHSAAFFSRPPDEPAKTLEWDVGRVDSLSFAL